MAKEKSSRGNASQFFIAGELCRRGYSAVVTLGNTPNTDILCSNIEGTKFVHIQVKTFVPGSGTCSVGLKSEYYIIPSKIMAKNIKESHRIWLSSLGKKGQEHRDNPIRAVAIPPKKSLNGWNISKYKNRWDIIDKKLK